MKKKPILSNSHNINAFLGEPVANSSCIGSVIKKDAPFNSGFQIFDLEMSLLSLYRALLFLKSFQKESARKKKHVRVLFLSTHSSPEVASIVEKYAKSCSQDYITTKWVGGTLNNWRRISKSIHAFNALRKWSLLLSENRFPRPETLRKCFSGYQNPFQTETKTKSRNKIPRNTKNLQNFLAAFQVKKQNWKALSCKKKSNFRQQQRNAQGLPLFAPLGQKAALPPLEIQKPMTHEEIVKILRTPRQSTIYSDLSSRQKKNKALNSGLPEQRQRPNLLVVLDPYFHKIAIHEAKIEGIPVIGFVNSDTNIKEISFPIYGNYQNHKFLHFCLSWICRVIQKNQKFPQNKNL